VFDPLKAYNSETNVYRIELISKRARLAQVIAHSEAMKRLDDAPESRETEGCAMETATPDHWRICSQLGVRYTIHAHNRHHHCRRQG
jgi:hypothetical protein